MRKERKGGMREEGEERREEREKGGEGEGRREEEMANERGVSKRWQM